MRKNLLAVTALAVALAPSAGSAGGYSVPNVNPRDLAMAGSLVASQEGAGAMFQNPAALGRPEGLHRNLGLSAIDIRSAWHDPNDFGNSSQMIVKLVFPPAIYASYGLRLPNDWGLGFGVGMTIPFGGNVYWPDTWPGRFDIDLVERRIFGTYVTAGLEPVKWLRIGGGFIWYRATEKLLQGTNYLSYEGSAELGAAGDGFSYDLSAEIQPIAPLRIGIDYKHQSVIKLTGQAHFNNPPLSLAANTLDQGVEHELTMPNVLSIGASYRVFPILLVTAGFQWDRYIVYDKDAFIGTAGTSIVVPRNYHNGHTYRLGVEGGPISGFKVRLGVLRDIAPTPREWMSPTIPDADVWATTVGVAYAVPGVPNLELSASYFHAFFDQVNTVNTPQNVFPGIYDTWANIASIGATWKWLPK